MRRKTTTRCIRQDRELTRVIFDRTPPAPRQLDLFDGAAWMRAAEAWAVGEGWTVDHWRVDHTFQCNGSWWRIAWDDQAGEWDVYEATVEEEGQ